MPLQVLSQNVISLQSTVVRMVISITDANGVAADPVTLVSLLMDIGGSQITTDTWPAPAARIVRTGVGQFYIDLGNQLPNLETANIGEMLMDWQVIMAVGGQITHTIEKIKIVSVRETSFIPELRLLIDKSSKLVAPNSNVFLGYTDSNLFSYLEGGLQNINAYQPSLTLTPENFPMEYKQILLDASLITGVMSQQLYAIDSDIPNYNDQGTAFVISHQPQLAQFLNALTQRLDRMIPMMKLQLITPGSLHVQMGPNYRLTQLVQAAPNGSLFRGTFLAGA